MDERIRKAGVSRRLVLLAAALVAPTAVVADEPSGLSVMRARLASGFGAGTDQGYRRRVPVRPAIVRPAARVIGTSQSPGSKDRAAAEQPTKNTTPMVTEVRNVPWEPVPVFPRLTSLAELIRASDVRGESSGGSATRTGDLEVRVESGQESIQVEMAPTVRRIELGTYDPNRPSQFESEAVVRLAEPVDAKLFPRPKVKPIEVPPVAEEDGISSNTSLYVLPELPDAKRIPDEISADVNNVQGNSAPAVLMRALADPELSQLIEATPEVPQDSDTNEASQRNFMSSERTRRLADISGFELLPLDRIGSQ